MAYQLCRGWGGSVHDRHDADESGDGAAIVPGLDRGLVPDDVHPAQIATRPREALGCLRSPTFFLRENSGGAQPPPLHRFVKPEPKEFDGKRNSLHCANSEGEKAILKKLGLGRLKIKKKDKDEDKEGNMAICIKARGKPLPPPPPPPLANWLQQPCSVRPISGRSRRGGNPPHL